MRADLRVTHIGVNELSREQRDIARRWCIFNSWGWPSDLPMPESNTERHAIATDQMAKAVREIGINRCLAYWNSEEFEAMLPIQEQFRSSRHDGTR